METAFALDRRAQLLDLLDRLAESAPRENGRPGASLALAFDGEFAHGYAACVLDLLAWLGALKADADLREVELRSPQAGCLLRLLRSLLDLEAPLVAEWLREGLTPRLDLAHPFSSAVDLLAALELRRLELAPGAEPLREVQAVVGLLMRSDELLGRQYLFVYDEAAGMWQLPGGRSEQGDTSPRATLLRELGEELGWDLLGSPDLLQLVQLGHPFVEQRLSPTYGLLTRTVFLAYIVQLARPLLDLPAGLRWVSEREALAGLTDDGQLLSAAPLLRTLALPGVDLAAHLPVS